VAFFKRKTNKVSKQVWAIRIVLLVLAGLIVAGVTREIINNLKAKDYTDPKNVPAFVAGKFVYDEGDILSDETEQTINAKSELLFGKSGATLVVASVPSLGGKNIEKVAYTFASKMAIGDKERDDGILLIFSKADQRVRLEIGKGLEGTITDGKAGRILDDYFVPYRNDDQYDLAAITTVDAVSQVLDGTANLAEDTIAVKNSQEMPDWIAPVMVVVFLGITAISVASSFHKQNKMYQKWLISHPSGTKEQWSKDRGLYGGWIYYSGGGFYGGFGGGGGGGSSGGSFGGGGASR
jgi:uncharacterized protein